MLPQHPPEVLGGLRQWALRGQVGLLLSVAVNAAGIDVVGALDATDGLQADTGGLERHDIDQAVLELVAGQVGTDEARRVGFGVGQSLELQFHGGDRVARWGLGQLLDVGVQVSRRHLRVAAGGGLQQGFVDEDVLVFSLDHVVSLGSHARHMAVDVHGLLVLHALQHGIDHDEAAGPAHARAAVDHHGAGVRRVARLDPP